MQQKGLNLKNIAGGCGCAICSGVSQNIENLSATALSTLNQSPTTYGSTDQMVYQLTDGYWESKGQMARQWTTNPVTYYISSLYNSSEKNAVRMGLSLWSEVANIQFKEVPYSYISDLDFQRYYNIGAGTVTYTNQSSITSGWISISTSWSSLTQSGGYGQLTIIHEIGHAIGLGHMGNYNGSVDYDTQVQYLNDNRQYSIMSYNNANILGTDHWNSKNIWQYAATPLLYDIAAAQSIYGANMTTRTGDTTYGFNVTSDIIWDQYDFTKSEAPLAIWDAGGIDTIDVSLYKTNQYITLEQGEFSSVGSMTNNLVIAYNTIIENAIGGYGDDTLKGNADDNQLIGNTGSDLFIATSGNDIYIGDDAFAISAQDIDTVVFDGLFGDFMFSFNDLYTASCINIYDNNWATKFLGIDSYQFIDTTYTAQDLYTLTITPKVTEQVIMEFGSIQVDHKKITVELGHDFINPVVFATMTSCNGGQLATTRITDVSSNSFDIFLDEASNLDGWHLYEDVSYIVMESGAWTLSDGTQLEAGTTTSNKISTTGSDIVAFETAFETAPAIFSQVQTYNGTDMVTTRHTSETIDGFKFGMQEEEALNLQNYHMDETIGWFAIETGLGQDDGHEFNAIHKTTAVNHQWTDIVFDDTLDDIPQLLAQLSSQRGPDPAFIRVKNTAEDGAQIRLQEDTSHDMETGHAFENYNVFAIAGSGQLTGHETVLDLA